MDSSGFTPIGFVRGGPERYWLTSLGRPSLKRETVIIVLLSASCVLLSVLAILLDYAWQRALSRQSLALVGTLSAGESVSVTCSRDANGISLCSSWRMRADGCLTGWLGDTLILSEKEGNCHPSPAKDSTGF